MLLIVSGPSGVGKSSVIERLVGADPSVLPVRLRLAISATTREPRPGEEGGVHYHFWDHERFRREIDQGKFLEYAEVHENLYGTPASEVDPHLGGGSGVVLDIDVKGADAVRKARPKNLSVFLTAPDSADYERRIRARGDADEAAIRRRLERAEYELSRAGEFDHLLVNENLDATVGAIRDLIARQLTEE